MKKFLLFILITVTGVTNYAQIRDYELGAQVLDGSRRSAYGGFYDYSDPEAINIKVSVWGFVRYPGRYIVPDYITVVDLLSYAGGPSDDTNLDELRIYRIENDKERMITIDFNDLMWEEGLESKYRDLPAVKPSDILVVPGEPRLYFMDWFSIGLSVFSALISLAILIITIRDL